MHFLKIIICVFSFLFFCFFFHGPFFESLKSLKSLKSKPSNTSRGVFSFSFILLFLINGKKRDIIKNQKNKNTIKKTMHVTVYVCVPVSGLGCRRGVWARGCVLNLYSRNQALVSTLQKSTFRPHAPTRPSQFVPHHRPHSISVARVQLGTSKTTWG